MASLLPNAEQQFIDNNGNPLAGGTVDFYIPNTTTRKDTWQDPLLTVLNTNPVVLDAGGRAVIWGAGSYRQVLKDQFGSLIWDKVVTDFNSSVFVTINSIATLRTLSKQVYTNASVNGYYAAGDGGGGEYWLDLSDVTSSDNGGTVIVAADGGRWKLRITTTVDVRQFGAKGDNVTDDGPALQNALNACAIQRIGTLTFSNGRYVTNQELLIRQGAQTTSSSAGSDIHFMPDQNKLVIQSDSHATLKAGTVITSLLHFSPTTVGGLGSYANFYSEIRGLLLDGNNQAGVGIYIDSAMHVKIERNAICNVTTGIFNTGYGVHDVKYNVIRATVCISYIGGGDSMFEHNDLFIATGGSGILLKPFAGSTLLHRNTYTPLDTTIADNGTKGVELRADNPGDDTKALGAIRIAHECFDGMRYGVYGRGFSAAVINLRAVDIHDCYIGGAGSSTGQLVDFAFATALNIHDNDITPGMGEPLMRSIGTLFTCTSSKVQNNNVNGCTSDALVIDGACSNIFVSGNRMETVGIGLTTQAYVRIKGSSSGTQVRNNQFIQAFATGALNGLVEQDTANNNIADYNEMTGGQITTEYVKVGASSVFKSRIHQSAAPGSGTWLAGAVNERPAPTAGTFMYDICTTGGTPGTWKTAAAITP